jgi:hypothetical protein
VGAEKTRSDANGGRLVPESALPNWDTRVWAGADSAWEQEELDARKMPINRADSPPSAARGVGCAIEYNVIPICQQSDN